ncbi:hypothetical protein DPMN_021444 [Dreissena polymorpha]|uniref:Uncharacterized protein n=1 Tax=Dreissena polymorpha TaxID=45954 RepID=A0A9D4SBS2_DREPO|nr:hypothetical protein DPMN_021444 [Dreissena polymorpha]
MECHSVGWRMARSTSARLEVRVLSTVREARPTGAVLLLIGLATPCCTRSMDG